MKKNWLIRTKSNHILGPVSLDKVKSLIENSSLKDEDELCSGNGYWFSVKEKNLLQKYIYEAKKQSYNPISEAKSVLGEDDDITKIGLKLDSLYEDSPKGEIKSNFSMDENEDQDHSKKKVIENNLAQLKVAKTLNSSILYILSIIFFLVAICAFYYRRSIIENILN